MKNLTALLLFFSLLGYAQDFSKYDRISKKDDLTINGIKATRISIEEVIENYGEPDRIEDFFFEIDNSQGFIYWYDNGLRLSIQNILGVKSFDITSDKYLITSDNIKVGDSIERLEELYPKSYSTGVSIGAIYLLFNDADYYLAFVFDKETKRITNINLYEF